MKQNSDGSSRLGERFPDTSSILRSMEFIILISHYFLPFCRLGPLCHPWGARDLVFSGQLRVPSQDEQQHMGVGRWDWEKIPLFFAHHVREQYHQPFLIWLLACRADLGGTVLGLLVLPIDRRSRFRFHSEVEVNHVGFILGARLRAGIARG
jgi:hypothetical protein